jgi:hypothetical protein
MEAEANIPQKNDSRVFLKIQLPSVFTLEDDAELKIIGYRFDLNQRLASTK